MAVNKSIGLVLLPLQSVPADTVVISNELNIPLTSQAFVGLHIGRRATPALSNPVKARVEGSVKVSGADYWFTLQEFTTADHASASESEAVNGTVGSGTKIITVASTTNLLIGNKIYIDNTVISNSEWARIKAVDTNVSVTIEDDLNNAQTGSTVFNKAEFFSALVDVRGIRRFRLVLDASQSGQAIAVDSFVNLFRE